MSEWKESGDPEGEGREVSAGIAASSTASAASIAPIASKDHSEGKVGAGDKGEDEGKAGGAVVPPLPLGTKPADPMIEKELVRLSLAPTPRESVDPSSHADYASLLTEMDSEISSLTEWRSHQASSLPPEFVQQKRQLDYIRAEVEAQRELLDEADSKVDASEETHVDTASSAKVADLGRRTARNRVVAKIQEQTIESERRSQARLAEIRGADHSDPTSLESDIMALRTEAIAKDARLEASRTAPDLTARGEGSSSLADEALAKELASLGVDLASLDNAHVGDASAGLESYQSELDDVLRRMDIVDGKPEPSKGASKGDEAAPELSEKEVKDVLEAAAK